MVLRLLLLRLRSVGILAHILLLALHIGKGDFHEAIATRIAQALALITEVVQGITYLDDAQPLLHAGVDALQDVGSREELALLALQGAALVLVYQLPLLVGCLKLGVAAVNLGILLVVEPVAEALPP